jgi:Flp pilus assembly protein TadD
MTKAPPNKNGTRDKSAGKPMTWAPLHRLQNRIRTHSFWRHFTKLHTLWKATTVICNWLIRTGTGLLLACAIIIVGTIVFQGLTQHATVINPLSVPKQLSERGFTDEVAAHRLRDAEADYVKNASSHMSGPELALHGDLPNIIVPTVGISLDAVVSTVHTLMRTTRSRTVSGEITFNDKLLYLRLRLDGLEIYFSKTGVDPNDPDALFADAVPALMKNIMPYLVAVNMVRSNKQNALEFVNDMIDNLPRTDAELPWFYNARGVIYMGAKNYAEAINSLQTAIALNKNLVVSYINLGLVYDYQRKYGSAERAYAHAIALEPNYALAHNNYGILLHTLHRDVEAEAQLGLALKIDKNYAAAHFSMGELYRDTHRPNLAVKEFSEAWHLDRKLIAAKSELDKLTAASTIIGEPTK